MLPKVKDTIELAQYVRQVADTLRCDLQPILDPNFPSGYFTIVRTALCYCDFAGALRAGDTRNTSKHAVEFIADYLGDINPEYRKRAALIYEMYRHGTVHIFAPKQIELYSGKVLAFAIAKREHTCYEGTVLSHLCPVTKGHKVLLPIATDRLVEDVVNGIRNLASDIESDDSIGANALRIYDEMSSPVGQVELMRKASFKSQRSRGINNFDVLA